jgi:small subunit ribosomal protein S20
MKAHRQNVARRARNREFRSRLRTGLKSIRKALDARDPAAASDALTRVQSLVDRMASKGIIHRNTAARYKSRLAARLTS